MFFTHTLNACVSYYFILSSLDLNSALAVAPKLFFCSVTSLTVESKVVLGLAGVKEDSCSPPIDLGFLTDEDFLSFLFVFSTTLLSSNKVRRILEWLVDTEYLRLLSVSLSFTIVIPLDIFATSSGSLYVSNFVG